MLNKGENLIGTLLVMVIFLHAIKLYEKYLYTTGQDKTLLMASISLFETKIISAQFFEKCFLNKVLIL